MTESNTADDSISREQVLLWAKQKEDIEEEIKSYLEILDSQKNVGMDEPLVDENGYPRNDIDVYQVRTARHKIICLRNDFKEKMLQIERGLHAVHKKDRENVSMEELKIKNRDTAKRDSQMKSILRVDEISHGSPADDAGLKIGDEIISFGSVNWDNFQNMKSIADIVQHSVEKKIKLTIKRGDSTVNVTLTPKSWSGRGLLGCNIVPLKK
ncbi:PSMD9 (predicted) [Pycnogonum litorale]